ncbi:MAG: hypothetical protein L0Y77_10610 [Chlorobi bacterium]|nr:hypothetical protein [Chlorobiota bacterium]
MKKKGKTIGEVNSSPYKYSFYVPENLDYEKEFPYKPYHHLYIMHKIHTERIIHRKTIKNGYVKLNMATLQNILHWRDTKRVLENLKKGGFIECDNHFIVGEKSRGYRLVAEYGGKTRRVEVEDRVIIRRLRRFNDSRAKLYPPKYQRLKDYLELVEIDYKKANKFIEENCTEEKYNLKRQALKNSSRNYLKEFNFEDWKNIYQHSVDSIYFKDDLYFVKDDTGHRVHTNITNLPKDLRQFLSYKGERLSNLDIANSQPFMLSVILILSAKMTSTFSLENVIFNSLNKSNTSYSTPLPYSNNVSLSLNLMPEDVKRYIDLTSNGVLYEYLMQDLGECDRQELKHKLFERVFYRDSNNKKREFKEEKIFRSYFPTVTELIKEFKAENYKKLPIEMQRKESEIVLERIAMRILREFPECYFLTIHDSILTPQSNGNLVKSVMEEEFQKFCGIVPRIKIE